VFAKALLIAGPHEAETIAGAQKEVSYLAVDRDGNISGIKKSLELIHDY
jgi:hypothetical protein